MSMDLRPLTLGELLDRSFGLYRTHFRTFVAIMAVPAVFAAAFGLLDELLPALKPNPEELTSSDFTPVLLMAGVLIGSLVFIVIYFVAYMVALGATTAAVSELYMGRTATAASAYGRVRGRIGSLMLLLMLVSLRMTGVFVAVGLVGILAAVLFGRGAGPLLGAGIVALCVLGGGLLVGFMSLRYALSVAALVLEPITARQAIRRSIALSNGNLLRIFVLVIFATVIAYITAMLFQGPFMVGAFMAGPDTRGALWLNLAGAFTGAVAGAISGPIMIIALGLLYYDARVRHEGLDLQLMLQTLDQQGAVPIAARPPAVLPG